MQIYCKLVITFCACHPRFSYYLQAKTKANSVGIGKQPAYSNGVNCPQNVHICCQGGLTAELPRKLPYPLRWSSVKVINFLWGISFNRSRLYCCLSISPPNFLLISARFLWNGFMTFRATWNYSFLICLRWCLKMVMGMTLKIECLLWLYWLRNWRVAFSQRQPAEYSRAKSFHVSNLRAHELNSHE